jgi:Zn-finger nucleic acid-binding protein
MKKAHIGQKPPVLIDVCPQGDGLWFDCGEVNQLIAQHAEKADVKPDSQRRILTFLGDTLKSEKRR